MDNPPLRVLITAEHASLQFGGEAALPAHYFRCLRQRGIEVWLLVHSRTRDELLSFFSQEQDRIFFIEDSTAHRLLWKVSTFLPNRIAYFTIGFLLRLLTQVAQRRRIKQLIQEKAITVIHQPIPVSPKEPSIISDMGVAVVMGPMNGGMDYPPAFQQLQSSATDFSLKIGRFSSNLFNQLLPGKLKADILLVANSRTQQALPIGVRGDIIQLVENGVDLTTWDPSSHHYPSKNNHSLTPLESTNPTKFVFIGRLVDWKAVDLLLLAFRHATQTICAELEIIGDGHERVALEEQAQQLGLLQHSAPDVESELKPPQSPSNSGKVKFSGWLSQETCAQQLAAADALVLPSLLECGGAVVLEAMAMGVPVIATNWGGPADYLTESCGILVDPSSRDEFIHNLTTAMLKLAQCPELAKAMGKAGHQRVLNSFDWEIKTDQILEIYQKAIVRYQERELRKISY